MQNRLVICSSPVDDNLQGKKYSADFANTVEYNFFELGELIKKYDEVILIDNATDEKSYWFLVQFANMYKLEAPVRPHSFYVPDNTRKLLHSDQILFLGCSHTHGSGHSKPETVYTHILSKMLDKKPVVDAHPAKGNWFTEEKLQKYDLKNATVIVQLTDMHRIMLNNIHRPGHEMTRAQYEVYSDEVLASIHIQLVARVVNLLRANNAQFLLFTICSQYPLENEVNSLLVKYPEYVYIPDYDLDTADQGHHLGVKSHTYWAKNLYERLTNSKPVLTYTKRLK